MEIALLGAGIWLLCGILAAVVANSKNRSAAGWLLGGWLTGVFGLIAIAGMPAREKTAESGEDWVRIIVWTVVIVLVVITVTTSLVQAADPADPAWIKERERLWEQIERECGDDAGGGADLAASLQECRARKEAARAQEQRRNEAARAQGREPGTIRLGDSQQYVEVQWGKPRRSHEMISQYGVTEWWEYEAQTVQFHNGAVATIHSH